MKESENLHHLSVGEIFKAHASRREACLVEAMLKDTRAGKQITIARNAAFTTTRVGRDELSQPENKNWRWASGGGLTILKLKDATVIPVRLRDEKAPSYPLHYTLGDGLSHEVAELFFPRQIAIREAMEELIIATPHGIAVASFLNPAWSKASFEATASGLWLMKQMPILPCLFRTDCLIQVTATVLNHTKERELRIVYEGNETEVVSQELIALDPETRGIGVICFIEIELPYLFEEISLFCGEDNARKPLDSEIACLGVPGFKDGTIVRTFQTGKIVNGTGDIRNMTPNLRTSLSAFGSIM